MKVTIDRKTSNLALTKDDDTRIYRDSTLFRKATQLLATYDVIVKDASKDGHLVSQGCYYIRDRKWRFAWWYPDY